MIQNLIDKQDTFEIVRDQIGVILATEVANQKALAIAAAKDPDLWDLKIYTERSNPWELYLNEDPEEVPIVNVWYEDSNFDASASNIFERQKTTAVYNIDCYGYGAASNNVAGGHNPGDREASLVVQRAIRLVRNILMSAEYRYLGLQGTVWQRWIRNIQIYQPQLENQALQQLVAARLSFQVIFNEFSPQFDLETLELIAVDVLRAEDGEIIVEADYQFPLP